MKAALSVLFVSAVVTAVACSSGRKSDPDETSSVESSGASSASRESAGVASVEEVAKLLEQAMSLGEATWPGAKLGGIKVSEGVPPPYRRKENVYLVHVSFQFESDPTDASAKSGSVVCSPECFVSRHKVKGPVAPAQPCSFDQALAAARRAGVTGDKLFVEFGSWNSDDRKGWTFRSKRDGTPVEIGPGCTPTSS